MPAIKNISSQPLYLNLPAGWSIKIPARATAEVEASDLESPLLTYHISRGNVIIVQRVNP